MGPPPQVNTENPIIVCDTSSSPRICNRCDTAGANAICTSCDQWGCGSNTAEVLGKKIGALHLRGLSNSAGFRIDPVLRQGGRTYELRIENGKIIATDASTNQMIVGKDLEGSSFMLHSAQPIGKEKQTSWEVIIEQVAVVPLFAERLSGSGAQGNAAKYEYAFAYALQLPKLGEVDYICPNVSAWGWETREFPGTMTLKTAKGPKTYDVLSWQSPGPYAVLVKGETYDPHAATVVLKGANGKPWFNIACAGTALAKMKLMGYDPEETGTHATTWAQRQATLKMITARYCGKQSFTKDGQPLIWQNAKQWFRHQELAPQLPDPIGDVEAVWNQDGAVCLNKPRRTQSWTQRQVIDACNVTIPRCNDSFLLWPFNKWFKMPVAGLWYNVPVGDIEWVTRHSAMQAP